MIVEQRVCLCYIDVHVLTICIHGYLFHTSEFSLTIITVCYCYSNINANSEARPITQELHDDASSGFHLYSSDHLWKLKY